MKQSHIHRAMTVLVLTLFVGGMLAALTPQVAEGARGGARGGGGAMRSGPASRGSVGHSRSSTRRDNRRDVRDDRRDNRREVRDNRREVRQDVRKERHEFREDRVRRHRARHLTYASFRALSCNRTVIHAGGVTYYSCGGTYYERVYQGSEVVYVVVSAPAGY